MLFPLSIPVVGIVVAALSHQRPSVAGLGDTTRSFRRAIPADLQGEILEWFGDSIDFDRVMVRRIGFNSARTIGNKILFPRRKSLGVRNYQLVFVHEMVHVWQYQHWGWTYLPCSLGNQLAAAFDKKPGKTKDKVYHFHYVPGKFFLEYPVEQQAQLAACAFAVQIWGDPLPMQENCPEWKTLSTSVQQQWVEEVHQAILHSFSNDFTPF